MLIDGHWSASDDGQSYELKLGTVFRATVRRHDDANSWIATLNDRRLTGNSELDYAKGLVEWEIVKELTNLAPPYRELKARAPTSSDLYPDGAWARWKAAKSGG